MIKTYDPVAQHRVQASSLIEQAGNLIESNPDRARLMIDAAAVAIAIADHYQRGRDNFGHGITERRAS